MTLGPQWSSGKDSTISSHETPISFLLHICGLSAFWNHKREELGLFEHAKHVNYAGKDLNDMNSRSQVKFIILLDTLSHYKLYFLKTPSHTGQALQNNFLVHNWASRTSTDIFLDGEDGNGEGAEI